MMKVLIVDDDNLVRRGLISLMPWNEFDMQVVGEAKNGEKALEFLESNEVDLILTDLAMPVMSGIELMKMVRSQYPQIFIVVLTLHQDFEYIQEALRLGAIDYIAKVQLEKESFEEVILRIRTRILDEQKRNYVDQGEPLSEVITIQHGYVLISTENSLNGDQLHLKEIVNPVELDFDLWFWLPAGEQEEKNIFAGLSDKVMNQDNLIIVKLGGVKSQKKQTVYRWLRDYKKNQFFYDFHPDHKIYEISLEELGTPSLIEEDKLTLLKNQWQSLEWVHQESLFEALIRELKMLQLTPHKLIQFLNGLVNAWNRIYSAVTCRQIELPDSFSGWYEMETWLHDMRKLIIEAIGKSQHSEEVQNAILRSIQIMHEEISNQVHASDVAKQVNMSRSYFSQCFKELAGMTFNEYLRHIRIERAKEYLKQTKKTIQWISENTGYADVKYFSRIFREKTGQLPSEYRQSFHSESKMSDY
jgi:two-component system response regulator YesN